MKDPINNTSETYHWKRPKAVADDIANELFQREKKFTPKLLALIVILCSLAYIYLRAILPDEVYSQKQLFIPFVFILFITISICSNSFIILFILHRNQGSYSVTHKQISPSCIEKSNRTYSWKRIKGYWIEESGQFPSLKCIFLKIRWQRYTPQIWLPEDTLEHPKILEFFKKHSVTIEPCHPEKPFSFTKKQLLFCWSFTIIFSITAITLFQIASLQKYHIYFLWAVTLGPGLISMAFVPGKKFFKDKQLLYAVILNMTSFYLFMAIHIVIELYKYHKIIESN